MGIRKLLFSIVFLVVLVAFFGIGIFAIIRGNDYTNNNITFELLNELAYSSVEGWYYLGQDAIDSNLATNHYEKFTYEENDELGAKTIEETTFPRWDIGESLLVYDDGTNITDIDVAKFVIAIENKNATLPLSVSLKGVGINETTSTSRGENLCFTKIQYTMDGQTRVMYNNDAENIVVDSKCEKVGKTISINNMAQLSVNGSIRIEILFTRNTRSESFEIMNNFSVQMMAVE